ncbi:hypothetical protein PsAD2_02912 [Pseudovibrio axinellae]|uniref:DUF2865 domain-containing protein n=1 Tax=Pseudovibrio axinellae TaxID=989403 RepID=A0A165XKJ3_9HYPH|nr:DUF2865 domain-containing protein [Pseudovibrio axinellae]KZL17794.1 hypothetical protein PsAD2_02912 [Pseudovibrio axinellae]SEP72281.1 Protein of unknown function [Pseudovibrio axinellae]
MITSRNFHSLATAALTLATSLIWAQGAFARPQVCDKLEAEFIELSEQVDNAGGPNSWQNAYEQQIGHIRNIQSQMSSNGCNGSFGPAQCQQLNSSLQQMNENLVYLDSQRQQELYSNALQDRLNEVSQALVDLDCSGRSNQLTPPARVNQQPLELAPRSTAGFSSSKQQFASMCVRKCDGYYFPINPNSTAEDLTEDEEICQALCPGQDTELYVFRVPQETPSQMQSLSGAPYTSLANAYSFRQQNNPACSCDANASQAGGLDLAPSTPPLDQAIQTGELGELTPAATPTYPAIPSQGELRQNIDVNGAQSENPEPALVQNKFVPREVEPREGPIRKVGPKFFPDQ